MNGHVGKVDSRCCKVCKVILGESVATQRRVVVLDICIGRWKRRGIRLINSMIRWWGFKGENKKCI